jgi:DNA adenine methylase
MSAPPPAGPFLKWAGGKRQLLPQLRRFVPSAFTAYTEAFLGSGALFFELAATGRLDTVPVTLIDSNRDLIGTWKALARDPVAVIDTLHALARDHAAAGTPFYYAVREERFNQPRRARRADPSSPYPAELAAAFIFLNRTGFNGLFRLNGRGDFNVPAGRYQKPRICDERTLMRVAALVARPNVFLVEDTFERLRRTAEPGEFIYFDPPYAPVSATAQFRSYTSAGFSNADQVRLQELVILLAERGCHVTLSNSVAPQMVSLYETNVDVRRAGLRPWRVPARRAINRNASARGPVEELLISNVKPLASLAGTAAALTCLPREARSPRHVLLAPPPDAGGRRRE